MSSLTLATGGYDCFIRFFDVTSRSLIRTIQFYDRQVLRLAYSSDAPISHEAPLFLIAGGSSTVAVYDVTHPETSPYLFQAHYGHSQPITAVGFEPRHSAFVFSASEDGTLQTWFPKMISHLSVTHPLTGQKSAPIIHPMAKGAYLPDGRFRYQSVPSVLRNKGVSGMVAIHDAVYYPPSDFFFTVDAEGRFRTWDHANSKLICTLVPHMSKRNLQCIEISADYNTIVMANFDGLVFVFYASQVLSFLSTSSSPPAVPLIFRASNRYVPRLRFNASGSLLVCTTSCGIVRVFRMADINIGAISKSTHPSKDQGLDESQISKTKNGLVKPLHEFGGESGWVWDAAFIEDRDNYLFTCSSTSHVVLWSLEDMTSSFCHTGHEKGVVCLSVRERLSPTICTEEIGRGSN